MWSRSRPARRRNSASPMAARERRPSGERKSTTILPDQNAITKGLDAAPPNPPTCTGPAKARLVSRKDENATPPVMNISTRPPSNFCRASAAVIVSTLLAGGCASGALGASSTSKPFPPGAQDPHAPHPGSISVKYAWNGSTEIWKAAEFPESFVFRCSDANGHSVARDHAAWCIPVVEIETVSVDQAGWPAEPTVAHSISSSLYGPGHTFLEQVTSGPSSTK